MRPADKRHLLIALLLAASVAPVRGQDSLPAPAATAKVSEDSSLNEKISYGIGLNLGRSLKRDGVEADLGALMAGMRDGLRGGEAMLTDQQIDAVMRQFSQQMQQKAEAKMADAASDNLAKGEKFLAENATKEGIQTTDSGLQYRILEEGEGASPGPADTVRCHYEGKLISGEVFDSSYKRGEPATFPVGGVIAGWTEALQLMKPGAKWEVFLPSKIAYGPRGAGGSIGPNETLIFQIELLEVVQ